MRNTAQEKADEIKARRQAEGILGIPQSVNDHPRDCPECRQGKHVNCTEVTIDPDTDEFVECECAQGGHL